MDVALVMTRSDGTRRTFPLRKERTVVGRTSSCDLRIPLSSVSRQHCEILKTEDQAKLRDLGSSNGTYRNDTRVQEAVLEPGDRLTIGSVVFQVMINGQPEIAERPRSQTPAPNPKPVLESSATAAPGLDDDADDLDNEVASALSQSGQEAASTGVEDPIAALEAMAADEDDGEPLRDQISDSSAQTNVPSRHPRPQPRAS